MTPPATHVAWTHRAEQRLEAQLSRARTAGRPIPSLVGRLAELDRRLAAAFRAMGTVVVLDVYSGYRPKETEHVLRCDLRDRSQRPHGTVIVKLTTEDNYLSLRAERDAWERTRPPGFFGDAVFMAQIPHYDPDEPHRLVAVSYRDAQPHIGTADQMSLDEAFRSAVRFDAPTADSVAAAIDTLAEHLHRAFHSRSHVGDPLTAHFELNPDGNGRRQPLLPRLRGWQSDPGLRVRSHVERYVPANQRESYRDALDVTDGLSSYYRRGGPDAARFIVRPRRGAAHGDLHGLNVLLGRTDDRVHSPAIFDFEHMSVDNLIALDFAKLETELKIRTYRHLFRYDDTPSGLPPRDFIEGVARVEVMLWTALRADGPKTLEENRFVRLIDRLRAAYFRRDGANPDESRREYALMLAAYALGTIKFPNLTLGERAAALVSAGVAGQQFLTLSLTRNLPDAE